jgi:hypothetical protein
MTLFEFTGKPLVGKQYDGEDGWEYFFPSPPPGEPLFGLRVGGAPPYPIILFYENPEPLDQHLHTTSLDFYTTENWIPSGEVAPIVKDACNRLELQPPTESCAGLADVRADLLSQIEQWGG